MTLALNKFEILQKQNLWNTKSLEEEHVIALTGMVQKLSDANLKLSKFLEDKKSKKGKTSDKSSKMKRGHGKRKPQKQVNPGLVRR